MTDRVATITLKPHGQNEAIYGAAVPAELLESIREVGILQPLIVTTDGIVISGCTRLRAARELEIKEVPVTVTYEEDPDKLLEMVVHLNRSRDRDPLIIARECAVLLEIERRRAKDRMNQLGESEEPEGTARDKVGEQVGWSGRTVARAMEVLEATEDGELEEKEAKAVQDKLKVSVRGAHTLLNKIRVHEPEEPSPVTDYEDQEVPKHLLVVFEDWDEEKKELLSHLRAARKLVGQMIVGTGGEVLKAGCPRTEETRDGWVHAGLESLWDDVVSTAPHAVCPLCKGDGCDECDQSGWLTKQQWVNLSVAQDVGAR